MIYLQDADFTLWNCDVLGTTAKVARTMGRKVWGCELNPDYCELIAKRTAQLSLLLGEEAV